ncbi:MAG: MotA/TolQ/ExbB proton channel family protein [Verrucomicrobiales bacterium]|nr:MotA/TolQ/ExbB proton channel family protein [Verrucomicrobiales bacterium]
MISFSGIVTELNLLIEEGGWVFLALIALAFGIAFALLSIWNASRLPEAPVLGAKEWRKLLHSHQELPRTRERLASSLKSAPDPSRRLQEIGQELFAKTERRLPFAFILISAAPLIGLLGTVSGMFKTFRGMSETIAASPVDVISEGISEALITTQTGLIIGVPTYIICAFLKSRHEELILNFRRLESQLLQSLSSSTT